MGGIFTMTLFTLAKEIIYKNDHTIIDADFCQHQSIVLLKNKNEQYVELNNTLLMYVSNHTYMIRFTKQHFCLLEANSLHFYTLTGDYISTVNVGSHIHQLQPFKDGVICIYGDEGVFGNDIGQNILNFAQPNKPLQSFVEIALQYDFSFDALFARFKPLAAINTTSNRILLFNENLVVQKMLTPSLQLGNVLAFAITYESAFFIKEHQIVIWDYLNNKNYTIPNTIQSTPENRRFRNENIFFETTSHEIIGYTFLKK